MIDITKARPRNKWVSVKADPRVKKTPGGLHLTEGLTHVERMMEGTGVVLRVGNQVADTCNFTLEPGMRICYRGFMKDTTAYLFEPIDDCPTFMIRAEDILAVIDDSIQMGAFS